MLHQLSVLCSKQLSFKPVSTHTAILLFRERVGVVLLPPFTPLPAGYLAGGVGGYWWGQGMPQCIQGDFEPLLAHYLV